MIDIPIGLPDEGYRNCDLKAQGWLGSSVFLGARRNLFDFESSDEANSYYWKHEGKGFGISRQLWCLKSKIKEVDDIMTPGRQYVVGETHPELVFWNETENKLWKKKDGRWAKGKNEKS